MMINKAAAAFALVDLPADLDAEAVQRCIEAIVALPAVDAVEVVRCKDCKHFEQAECPWDELFLINVNGYCSRGERKEEDNMADYINRVDLLLLLAELPNEVSKREVLQMVYDFPEAKIKISPAAYSIDYSNYLNGIHNINRPQEGPKGIECPNATGEPGEPGPVKRIPE